MEIQQLANDGKSKIIITFESDDAQIEIVLAIGTAETLCDRLTAEIQDVLRARRRNIGVGL